VKTSVAAVDVIVVVRVGTSQRRKHRLVVGTDTVDGAKSVAT